MKSKKELYDELLILKVIDGNIDAFSELMERWEHRLFYYLKRLMKNESEVEDVLQETWINIYRFINKIRDISQYRTWLFKIARNKAIDYMRAKKRRESIEFSFENKELEFSLEENFETKMEAECLHQAIESMATWAREILILFYLNEFTMEEISNVMDIPKGTVKSRLHYARKKLKEILEERNEYK